VSHFVSQEPELPQQFCLLNTDTFLPNVIFLHVENKKSIPNWIKSNQKFLLTYFFLSKMHLTPKEWHRTPNAQFEQECVFYLHLLAKSGHFEGVLSTP
jgi:hypothetical protein